MRSLISRYAPPGSFASHVLTLMTGTTIAQLIPIAISPLLTRMYEPGLFGILAVYMSTSYILSVLVTGRYELAVILPERDEDAANLVILSFLITLSVSSLILIGVLLFNKDLSDLLGNPGISTWLYFIPLSVFLYGVFTTLNYWSTRFLRFKRLVLGKFFQTSTNAFLNVSMGASGFGASGLVLGYVASQAASSGFLGWQVFKNERHLLRKVDARGIKEQFKKYRNFPIFSIPADFINVLSNQLPVYALSIYFNVAVVGFFSLTQRVLAAPISLISQSILDVFKQRASADFARTGNCREIYIQTLKSLVVISLVPTLVLMFLSPFLFKFIFGNEWVVSGKYAQIMSVMFFFRFVSSPLGFVIYIAEKQAYDLVWQAALFISTIASFAAGVHYRSEELCIWFYSVSYTILYIVYLIISYILANGKDHRQQ